MINIYSQVEDNNNTKYRTYSLTNNLTIKSDENNDHKYIFNINKIETTNEEVQIVQVQGIVEYLNYLANIYIQSCSYKKQYIQNSNKIIKNYTTNQIKIKYQDILIAINKFQYILENDQKKVYKIYPEYYIKYKDILIFGDQIIIISQNKTMINQIYINEKNNLFSGVLNKLRINYDTKTISILEGSATLQHDLKLTFGEITSDNFKDKIIINKLKIDQNQLTALNIKHISINITDQNINLSNIEIEIPDYYIKNNTKHKLPKNIVLKASKGFINQNWLSLEDVRIYHKNKELFMIENIQIDLNKLLEGENFNINS